MKRPRLVFADTAVADVVEQADWYKERAGAPLAKRWEKAVTSALLRILANAGAGARCTFRHTGLRDVRRAAITGFPKHLFFYQIQRDEIFIPRIVHGARDLEHLF